MSGDVATPAGGDDHGGAPLEGEPEPTAVVLRGLVQPTPFRFNVGGDRADDGAPIGVMQFDTVVGSFSLFTRQSNVLRRMALMLVQRADEMDNTPIVAHTLPGRDPAAPSGLVVAKR